MLLPVLGLVSGLVLLTVAADRFVTGAARVAAGLRLSPVVIGAVIIGVGTSAPELIVSSLAAGQGSLDIAVGNVVGSNVANLSLVLGAAALVTPIVVESPTLRREAPITLAATLLLALIVQDGFTRLEGILLLVALVAAVATVLRAARRSDRAMATEVEEFLDEDHAPIRTRVEVVRTLAGLVGTLIAAQILVVSATTIAAEVGLAEGFVGLTIVALGTSLPELATGLQAARRGETDLIVGNLLGSNLFNSLAVAGAAATIGPSTLADPNLAGPATYLMVGVGVTATVMMITGRRVVRTEGIVLLAGYVVVVPLLA